MQAYLQEAMPERTYLVTVGIMAFIFTVSMTIPFASILIGAVLLRHVRWKEIVLVSSLGSATGGLFLYFTFYYLGWSRSPPHIQTCFNRKHGLTRHDGSPRTELGRCLSSLQCPCRRRPRSSLPHWCHCRFRKCFSRSFWANC
jgi:hypothetical protein